MAMPRWMDSVIEDSDLQGWIMECFFPVDYFEPSAFESSVPLFHCTFHTAWVDFVLFGRHQPAPFTKEQVDAALLGGCATCGYGADAVWFAVTVDDGMVCVFRQMGRYQFDFALEPLLWSVTYRPAEQGGPSFAGILDRQRRWAFMLQASGSVDLSIHGPPEFCRVVQGLLFGAAAPGTAPDGRGR